MTDFSEAYRLKEVAEGQRVSFYGASPLSGPDAWRAAAAEALQRADPNWGPFFTSMHLESLERAAKELEGIGSQYLAPLVWEIRDIKARLTSLLPPEST